MKLVSLLYLTIKSNSQIRLKRQFSLIMLHVLILSSIFTIFAYKNSLFDKTVSEYFTSNRVADGTISSDIYSQGQFQDLEIQYFTRIEEYISVDLKRSGNSRILENYSVAYAAEFSDYPKSQESNSEDVLPDIRIKIVNDFLYAKLLPIMNQGKINNSEELTILFINPIHSLNFSASPSKSADNLIGEINAITQLQPAEIRKSIDSEWLQNLVSFSQFIVNYDTFLSLINHFNYVDLNLQGDIFFSYKEDELVLRDIDKYREYSTNLEFYHPKFEIFYPVNIVYRSNLNEVLTGFIDMNLSLIIRLIPFIIPFLFLILALYHQFNQTSHTHRLNEYRKFLKMGFSPPRLVLIILLDSIVQNVTALILALPLLILMLTIFFVNLDITGSVFESVFSMISTYNDLMFGILFSFIIISLFDLFFAIRESTLVKLFFSKQVIIGLIISNLSLVLYFYFTKDVKGLTYANMGQDSALAEINLLILVLLSSMFIAYFGVYYLMKTFMVVLDLSNKVITDNVFLRFSSFNQKEKIRYATILSILILFLLTFNIYTSIYNSRIDSSYSFYMGGSSRIDCEFSEHPDLVSLIQKTQYFNFSLIDLGSNYSVNFLVLPNNFMNYDYVPSISDIREGDLKAISENKIFIDQQLTRLPQVAFQNSYNSSLKFQYPIGNHGYKYFPGLEFIPLSKSVYIISAALYDIIREDLTINDPVITSWIILGNPSEVDQERIDDYAESHKTVTVTTLSAYREENLSYTDSVILSLFTLLAFYAGLSLIFFNVLYIFTMKTWDKGTKEMFRLNGRLKQYVRLTSLSIVVYNFITYTVIAILFMSIVLPFLVQYYSPESIIYEDNYSINLTNIYPHFYFPSLIIILGIIISNSYLYYENKRSRFIEGN
ncbi:MAG: hypothetical protein HeimC2_42050 [Candidatus Heimdallarchaeota archaeon LC_2]|nr:MAG: hypothetical protein HeimC2_42050 [Candidatus Heimdallarchaeota archaeon LC_2]